MMNQQATRYGMSPEEKDELYSKLTEKFGYDKVKFDQPMEEATESAGNKRLMGSIIDGIAQIGTANAVARGGRGYDGSAGKILNQAADTSVAEAANKRKAMIEDYLTKKNLGDSVEEQSRGMAKDQIAKERYDAEMARRDEDRAYNRQRDTTNDQFRRESITENRLDRQDRQQEKIDEKMQSMQTPYGLANSVDDAKQLKAAHESKQSFDSKIQEMIELREKYGGELFNREAVARGKQLSKDLLLEYKNMAKLGVLSKSDEAIINAIIADDPLAFSASGLVGQDPILHTLKKFKEDSDKDFQTRVKTRTRDGGAASAVEPATDPRVKSFMEKNGITDEAEAIQILKDAGKL